MKMELPTMRKLERVKKEKESCKPAHVTLTLLSDTKRNQVGKNQVESVYANLYAAEVSLFASAVLSVDIVKEIIFLSGFLLLHLTLCFALSLPVFLLV